MILQLDDIQSDLLGLFGGSFSTYAYANNAPNVYTDPTGLTPKPVPPERQRWRACDAEEIRACEQQCSSTGMSSCRVSQTWRVSRIKGDLVIWGWADGPMSCSCNECEGSFSKFWNWLMSAPPKPASNPFFPSDTKPDPYKSPFGIPGFPSPPPVIP